MNFAERIRCRGTWRATPRILSLRTKTEVLIRPAETNDIEGLYRFFSAVPRSDLLIYKDDVSRLETIESWFTDDRYKKMFQLISLSGSEIIAKGTLHNEGLYWQHAR